MKVNLSKGFFIKVFFWLFVVFLVAAYNEFARYGLPDAKGVGNRDDQSVAFFILSILLFLSVFRKNISRPIITIFFFLLSIFAISNWWYYDFYRDYLTLDTVRLAIYAKESMLAWEGLKYKEQALFYVLSLLFLVGVYFKLDPFKPGKKTLLVVAIVSFVLAAQQQVVISGTARGGLKHRGINHISYFVKSFFPEQKLQFTAQDTKDLTQALPGKKINNVRQQYPLFQDVEASIQPLNRKKNILLVVMESVRMAETGLYADAERSLTPNLDKLAKESLNFPNYYANSNQTVRGEVAILCSALDYINGAPSSTSGEKLGTNCLPTILNEYGYNTYWIHGYKKSFFNRKEFFPKLGFKEIIDLDVLTEGRELDQIGWGVSDVELFDSALEVLEKSQKPFIAEVLTLSNHYPFLWDWGIPFPKHLELKAELEEGKDNVYPAYQRGIYYTDYALGKFLERFKKSKLYDNTLLVVTSDHGIWSFPDDLTNSSDINSELIKNEMYFRLPLLFHAADLTPAVYDNPVSQVDIAPSVLDYLGITYPNAFLGNSLFELKKGDNYPVYLLAAGSYGVRRGGDYCYPIDTSELCSNYHRKCDTYTLSNAKTICVSSEKDILASRTVLDVVEVDKTVDDLLIDYSQHFLRYGFMPSEQLL